MSYDWEVEKKTNCCDCDNEGKYRSALNGYYCDDCYDEAIYNKILDGNFDSKFSFLKEETDDDLYLGFELETEQEYDEIGKGVLNFIRYLHKSKQKELFYQFKEDGSLEHGVEMVSNPITLNHLKTKYKFKDVIKKLNNLGFDAYTLGTCGFHIHVNKKFFTSDSIIRMRAFFSLNQDNIYTFSKRDSDNDGGYCDPEEYDLNYFLTGRTTGEKYRALNLDTGRGTLEIRIFRGNNDYKRLLAYLEFADAVSRYCVSHTLNDICQQDNSGNSWKKFTSWIKENKNNYKYLVKMLKQDKLL